MHLLGKEGHNCKNQQNQIKQRNFISVQPEGICKRKVLGKELMWESKRERKWFVGDKEILKGCHFHMETYQCTWK